MSINKGPSIINPMSRTILGLRVDDSLQIELKSELAPREVMKLLGNIQIELMCNYIDSIVKEATQSKLT